MLLMLREVLINSNFLQSKLIRFVVKNSFSLSLPPFLTLFILALALTLSFFFWVTPDGALKTSASFTRYFHLKIKGKHIYLITHSGLFLLTLTSFSLFVIIADSSVTFPVPCNLICLHSIFFLGKEINSDKVMTST